MGNKIYFLILLVFSVSAFSNEFKLTEFEKEKLAVVEADPTYTHIKESLATKRMVYTKSNKIPTTLVDLDIAEDLSDLFARYSPGFGDDGNCYARTYFFHLIFRSLGMKGASAIVTKVSSWLRPILLDSAKGSLINPDGSFGAPIWRYHIAPVVCVGTARNKPSTCSNLLVLDDGFSNRPMSTKAWRKSVRGKTRLSKLDIVPPGVVANSYSKFDMKNVRWWSGYSLELVRGTKPGEDTDPNSNHVGGMVNMEWRY